MPLSISSGRAPSQPATPSPDTPKFRSSGRFGLQVGRSVALASAVAKNARSIRTCQDASSETERTSVEPEQIVPAVLQ